MATSQRASLLPGAENHRHGRVSGDDGLTKIVRTFHARFGSVKLGGSVTARERLAYVHREGKHAGDAADVEATAGDKEKVIEASDRIRDTARVRRGKTAERLLATQVIELPMESTAEQRRTCADAFVADWRGRGHQAVAVVHVHGEEHKQPHLHVEIAARPVDADGSVNRSATRLWAGGHPAVEVKKERARAADIVNRTCDPDPPYHPGGFRDIGVERQPRTRIPAGKFREAREEIRDARAAGLREGLIEATAYAVSDKERGKKREARVGRTAEIIEFRAAGLPARPSQRARLAFAEPALKAERERADKAEGSLARRDDAARDKAEQEKIAAGQALADERARAEKAEASAATLTDEKQKAEGERDGLQDRVRVLEELNKRQTKYVTNWHANRKVVLPDLATVEGQSAAWTNMWAWDARALKAARDEAGAAVTAATTAEKERDEQRERAEKAERERDGFQGRVHELEALNRTQTEYVTNWHANRKVVLPNLATVEGQSAAWANMWAWDARALKAARDEAGAALTAAATAEKERDEQRERAEKAERERDGFQGRVHELEALNRTQTEYVTDWHGDRKVVLPDLATVEGQSAAWANMRAWQAEEKKRRTDEAAAQAAAKAGIEAALEAALERAEKAEDEKQKAEGRVRELEAGTASGTEAAAVREAQPVPDAVPKPLDLPAAWTLPVDELIKAGDVVARKAAAKWGGADSSPTSMPLDGIDGVPVLTFTPEHGLLRKKPASWRYEDAGRYAGEAAIELEQPGFTDRNLDSPNWRAAAEALSRALVTDALEDGAETPRWLEEQFPDLDKKYGPKIRTRKYPGENPRTYVGEMSGGKPHGAGTTTWKSGDRYEGAFENGHRHGQGVYDFPNGNRYEGAWQEGERAGQGVMTYADGGRYEGGWRKGKQHGAGIVISPEGEITEGVWEDGKRVEAAAKKTQTRYLGPEL